MQSASHFGVLSDPFCNQGTAFSEQQRFALGLEGLLPSGIDTLERQIERVLGHLETKPTDIERYVYLQDLAERNQTLFFATLMSDPARFVPIVYDPTIADACLSYGQIFRRPQGMYLNKNMKGRFAEVLKHWPNKDVRFICVTSGGRILGLGDIGVNGAPIPIGKLQLYTACAGVPPEALLPIHLDIGTTNAALRADPLYLGLRETPPCPDEVDAIVDSFMQAANEVFPGVCVHFEDWKGTDAIRLLDRYQDQYLVYNDDIQGTASVTLAGLITALQIKKETLADQRILFAGAGSAGIGIADMLVEAMQQQGVSQTDARAKIHMFDADGLLTVSRTDLSPSQTVYAHDLPDTSQLENAVKQIRPTILIGVSTVGGLFTEGVVQAMHAQCERPIIFPLSNPTNHAEASAEQLYTWTDGQAIVAAGVQFPDVTLGGKTFHPGQANNFYIFPAVGLAVYATRPQRINDAMFIAAAQGSADQVRQADRDRGMLFPRQDAILETEITTAARVAEFIFDQGEATVPRPHDIRAWIESMVYTPAYEA